MRKFIVGNWKMNGVSGDIPEIAAIAALAHEYADVDVAICLPASLISRATLAAPGFTIGGQDCHAHATGAHTGCVSAPMLADAGASLTIIGHSERRCDQHETDAEICAKAMAAHGVGLKTIVCVGETLTQRDAGHALEIVLDQLVRSLPDSSSGEWLSIAYEPIWAIGTGRIPDQSDVAEMHDAIRKHLISRFGPNGEAIRILYGGSMNGENAQMLLGTPNVDGGLIGGASLSAAKFGPIIKAAAETCE